MSRHITRHQLVFIAALLFAGLTGTLAVAEDVLRLTRNIAGDSKPVVLNAAAAATWSENGQRVILLSGKVLVEHGLFSARCTEAVLWLDEAGQKRTRILKVQLYAEGDAVLEDGTETKRAAQALVDLSTRGEVKLRIQGKVAQEPKKTDPLYLRGMAVKSPGAATPPAAPGKPSAAPQPAPAKPQASMPPAPAPSPLGAPIPIPPAGPGLPAASAITPATTGTAPVQPAGFFDKTAPPPAPAPPAPAAWPVPPTQPPTPPTTLVPTPITAPTATPPLVAAPLASVPNVPVSTPTPALTPTPVPVAAAMPTGTAVPAGTPAPTPGPITTTSAAPRTPPPPKTSTPQPANSKAATSDNVPRIVTISPRTTKPFEWQSFTLSTGERAIVVTGGVMLLVRNTQNAEIVDIESDRLVFWTHGDSENLFANMRTKDGQTTKELEFYLAGNVEIRQQSSPADNRTLRADEVYYDVGRNVAVAMTADLEMYRPGFPDPMHMKAEELLQLSPTLWEGSGAEVFSSRLPSDPGLKVYMRQVSLEQTGFGPSRRSNVNPDGTVTAPQDEAQFFFRGTDVFLELEDTPIFYLPFMQGDVRRPLGPLVDVGFGEDRIFGARLQTSWDAYDLFGIKPQAGTRWNVDFDYLSSRGPAMGSQYDYSGKNLFDITSTYTGFVHTWGIYDTGEDDLGGYRTGQPHPDFRGYFQFRNNWWGLPDGFTVQTQLFAVSDMNFYEQYFKNDWDTGLNEDSYVYVKQQDGFAAWTGLVEPRIRNWITETSWLPRFDGWLLGVSPFDVFTYSAHASAAWAELMPTTEPQFDNQYPVEGKPTQARVNTDRLDLYQELALPLTLGPIKAVPYGVVDLTSYSEDLNGNEIGRFYGAGGIRASMPLSHLYRDVASELFNVDGLYHKMNFSANYYIAHSDVPFSQLPQLDQLQDEATNQSIRDITPIQQLVNPNHGLFLMNSPLYDPQLYALRNLVLGYTDTLDTMEVLQFDLYQRLQTKRGYPGMEHEVDWMVLDLQASYYPHPGRDNFGESFDMLQYDYLWNIGDRTSLVSSGFYDPVDEGARIFTIGVNYNRTDRTTFSLGYRHIYPLDSDAVSAAVTYIFSPKYAMTASTVYDFGTGQALSNSLVFTRMGSDLQVSLGFTYNVLQNNFGAIFMIVPNLMPGMANGVANPGMSSLMR